MNLATAVHSALDGALAADPKVILLGEDIADPAGGVFKTTQGLSTKYGAHRVRATPIAEQSILGAAIGASLGGYRPVAEIMFFDFITVCLDQLVNHAAKFRYMSGGQTPVPLVVRTAVGSKRFGAQHAQQLEAWLMHTPGLCVVMPSTPFDAKGLLTSAIFGEDPVVFIEHINLLFGAKDPVPVEDYRIPLGRAAVRMPGDDVTIVTYGEQVAVALEAAEGLAADGIEAEVIDLRSLVPLDMPTVLASVSRTKRAIVTHGATTFCGPGAEIASQISEQLFGDLVAPVARLGARYAPIPFSADLEVYPTAADIVAAARRLCG
ncbi:MAG: alpha-ketoacid dehydrogenase subunit beta [Actinobacteria bacterium]|nr:alpha-ketoacid dehydrogenase subunit beta [Actinomycetota bacterium]